MDFQMLRIFKEIKMNARNILAILFIVVGVIGLAYGGFSYTGEVHRADIGSLHLSLAEKEHVYIPVWAGVAFILCGGLMLAIRKKF
jgi:hypothetical protein